MFLRPILYILRGTETSINRRKKEKPISEKHHLPKLEYHCTARDPAHCFVVIFRGMGLSSGCRRGIRVSQSPYEGQGTESRWCVPQPELVTLPQWWRLSVSGICLGCSGKE